MAEPLSVDRVPESARLLVALAERWGIEDDIERELAIAEASVDSLRELATALEQVSDDFWSWLAGPESFSASPPAEYTAFTCLTMAVDSARVKLANTGEG